LKKEKEKNQRFLLNLPVFSCFERVVVLVVVIGRELGSSL
jgi:hypothetical protein